MGWLQKHNRTASRKLGGNMISEAKRGAPLRKIVAVVRAYNNLFSQDRVLLECGHETNSNATYRARCPKCKVK